MKRVLALALAAALLLTMLCACSNANSNESLNPSELPEASEPVQSPAPAPEPSAGPSSTPSEEPSAEPSVEVSAEPSVEPSPEPTAKPSPTPQPTVKPTPAPTPTPEPTPTPDARVELAAFYGSVTDQYEFGSLELAGDGLLDGYYAGLSGISMEQCLVYICKMNINNGEFGLVQVSDSKDVDAVKAIFQARIDYMVGDGNGPGGAWYPSAMDQWENNSRVVSNGNYVMMVVHENCDDIVSQFNALF